MTESDELAVRAGRWAAMRDGRSLRAIRAARAQLVKRATGTPPCVESALALARLVDSEGWADDLARALDAAIDATLASDPARGWLELGRAQLDYEAGDLEGALARLTRARDGLDRDAPSEILATARLSIASTLHRMSRPAEADGELEALPPLDPWPHLRAHVEALRAERALSAGRRAEARRHYERSLQHSLVAEREGDAAMVAGILGNLDHDAGYLESALRWFDEALALADDAEAAPAACIFGGYRGWVLHELGRLEEADAAYERAIRDATALEQRRFRHHFEALQALRCPDPTAAELRLSRALAGLARCGDHARAGALEVLRGHVEAARAQIEARPEDATRRLIQAHGAVERAQTGTDDGRIALRMTRAKILEVLAERRWPDAAIEVVIGGSALRVGGGERFDLERHSSLQRMLWRLVEGWAERRSIADAELIEAGWPNERLLETAARRRLQVAVSTLRKSGGLGELLRRGDDGYRLAPETTLRLAPPPSLD